VNAPLRWVARATTAALPTTGVASPAPGALGPAVVVGHVDSAVNGPAVLCRLTALLPGDLITTARSDGRTAVCTVTGVREHAVDQFPTQLVYADSAYAAPRLITCGGSVDGVRPPTGTSGR